MLFTELGLRSEILSSLEVLGYATPTDIQGAVIPLALAGKHIVAQSQTGSGKTASFVIPILHGIDTQLRKPQALILEPTRELAMQSKEEVWNLSKGIRMRSSVVFGGSYIRKQREELAGGPQVVIATPGRLLDLMDRGWIDLSAVKTLVIDEVDMMMDMGFIDAVSTIWKALPALQQVMTFSATYSDAITRLISENIGTNYETVRMSQTVTVDTIDHAFIRVSHMDKYLLLKKILTDNPGKRTIIFTKMKSETEELFRYLERDGIASAYLHGDLYQRDRIRTLRDYKEGRIHTFIATDIAARGLNMNNIDIVVNYHVPLDPESYVHRIGRTGRAGASGKAYMFVSSDEKRQLERIERVNRIEVKEIDKEGNLVPRQTGHQSGGRGGSSQRRPFHGRNGGAYQGGYSRSKPYYQRENTDTPRGTGERTERRPVRSYREHTESIFDGNGGKFMSDGNERRDHDRGHSPRPSRPTHRYEERRPNYRREPRENNT